MSVPVTRTLPAGYDNDLGLANTFAEFFDSKISNIVSRFESTGATWSDSNPCTVSGIVRFDDFEPLSERDVGLLRRVKCTPNLDVLPQTQFSEMFALMLPFISKLINSSLSSGVFPSCFKKSQISPLLKSTDLDPNELNSYPPVSNLPFISKMIETAVNNQFMDHIESNSLLNSHQSAYRKGYSVKTAFQHVYSSILHELDRGQSVFLVLLDLSAAFDTLSHANLVSILQSQFNVGGTVLRWFHTLSSVLFKSE